jgi:hypothetical protein
MSLIGCDTEPPENIIQTPGYVQRLLDSAMLLGFQVHAFSINFLHTFQSQQG